MSRAKTEGECGINPFWKVRVCLPGAILHFASRAEPTVYRKGGRLAHVDMDLVTDTGHGDTLGYIDWEAVTAVTWRKDI